MAKRDLVKLLVRLYGDPKLNERMKKNPKSVMKSAKLSAKEQEVLAGGDEKIREYLGNEAAKAIIINAPAIIISTSLKKKSE